MRIRLILILSVLFSLFLFGAMFFSYIFVYMSKLSYIDAQNMKITKELIDNMLKKKSVNEIKIMYSDLRAVFRNDLYIAKDGKEIGNLKLKTYLKKQSEDLFFGVKNIVKADKKIFYIYNKPDMKMVIIGRFPYVPYSVNGYSNFVKGLFVIYFLLVFGVSFIVYLVTTKRVVSPINRITDLIYDYSYKGSFNSIALDDRRKTIEDIMRIMNNYFGNVEEKMRKAYEENRKNQLKLITAQRLAATGKLAAGIAHEINNPISGMINALRMIKNKKNLDKDILEYIDLIEDGLTRISTIVKKILQFNNINMSKSSGTVYLEKSIKNAIEFVSYEIRSKNINISIKNNLNPDVKIRGSEIEFQQIIMNLVINAIDAIDNNGNIIIEINSRNNKVLVSIKDDGCGIDEKSLHQIFDMFYSTKEDKGTGLGLYIVYNLVKEFNGEIEILSEKGKGTEVVLEFPKVKED